MMSRGSWVSYIFLALVLLGFVLPNRADAAFGVGVVYGLTNPTLSGSNTTSATKSYTTYGALAELPVGARSGLLLGILYSELGGHQTFTGFDMDVKLPYYQVPVLIDYWLIPEIAVGIGGYYGIPGGNATQSGTVLGVVSTSRSDTFSNLNYRGDDFGLAANIRAQIPLGPIFVSGDLIYEYGLENVSTSNGQTLNNRALLAMIGVGIGI